MPYWLHTVANPPKLASPTGRSTRKSGQQPDTAQSVWIHLGLDVSIRSRQFLLIVFEQVGLDRLAVSCQANPNRVGSAGGLPQAQDEAAGTVAIRNSKPVLFSFRQFIYSVSAVA